MRSEHLSGDELDLLLLGYGGGEEISEHAANCLLCRRRLTKLQRVLVPLAEMDPSPVARARARQAALAAWGAPPQRRRAVWWWVTAAALAAALSLPLWQWQVSSGKEVDTVEVLAQVDALLAGDPVSAVFPAELVAALAGEVEGHGAGSDS